VNDSRAPRKTDHLAPMPAKRPPSRRHASKSAARPVTIDDYLSRLADDQRAALDSLRRLIRSTAPEAEECISYGVPAFRLNGMLVGFGATKNHCSFFLFNGSTVEAFADALKGYETSKGAVRFAADAPLPASLVRKLVQARMAENARGM